MKKLSLNIRLLIAFAVLLTGSVIIQSYLVVNKPLPFIEAMNESVKLTKYWFGLVEKMKIERGIESDAISNVPNNFMIGDEWSDITTTLGSLEAKETSTNPDFAALIVRLLNEAKIKKGEKVGVILSGSFPALGISVLAALQEMELEVVLMSSLGSSTYGANQSGATWIDIESVLLREGGLKYRSNLVSAGSGNDSGSGLSESGFLTIRNAVIRNNVSLYLPSTLLESIEKRVKIFEDEEISLLINIGGNETALGGCAHSSAIPNGLNYNLTKCSDPDRGVIARMNEKGVPYINLLDIKNLAGKYGITVSPGIKYAKSVNLFTETRKNRLLIGLILAIGLSPMWFIIKNKNLTFHIKKNQLDLNNN